MKKKYNIIYADPPWSYYNDSTAKQDCTTVKGMRRPPYQVMSSNDIKALPIKEIADNNAILFIWTTDYHLTNKRKRLTPTCKESQCKSLY